MNRSHYNNQMSSSWQPDNDIVSSLNRLSSLQSNLLSSLNQMTYPQAQNQSSSSYMMGGHHHHQNQNPNQSQHNFMNGYPKRQRGKRNRNRKRKPQNNNNPENSSDVNTNPQINPKPQQSQTYPPTAATNMPSTSGSGSSSNVNVQHQKQMLSSSTVPQSFQPAESLFYDQEFPPPPPKQQRVQWQPPPNQQRVQGQLPPNQQNVYRNPSVKRIDSHSIGEHYARNRRDRDRKREKKISLGLFQPRGLNRILQGPKSEIQAPSGLKFAAGQTSEQAASGQHYVNVNGVLKPVGKNYARHNKEMVRKRAQKRRNLSDPSPFGSNSQPQETLSAISSEQASLASAGMQNPPVVNIGMQKPVVNRDGQNPVVNRGRYYRPVRKGSKNRGVKRRGGKNRVDNCGTLTQAKFRIGELERQVTQLKGIIRKYGLDKVVNLDGYGSEDAKDSEIESDVELDNKYSYDDGYDYTEDDDYNYADDVVCLGEGEENVDENYEVIDCDADQGVADIGEEAAEDVCGEIEADNEGANGSAGEIDTETKVVGEEDVCNDVAENKEAGGSVCETGEGSMLGKDATEDNVCSNMVVDEDICGSVVEEKDAEVMLLAVGEAAVENVCDEVGGPTGDMDENCVESVSVSVCEGAGEDKNVE